MKTVYCLKVRLDDKEEWSEPSFFTTRRQRDKASAFNRILGGIRTWGYAEKMSAEQLKAIEFQ